MAKGFIILYLATPERACADAIVTTLEQAGLGLENPANGKMTQLVGWGDQVPLTRDELLAYLSGHDIDPYATVQLWVGPNADVVLHVDAPASGMIKQQYWFDGLRPGEVDVVTRAVASLLGVRDIVPHGLVVDRTGAGEEFDWDTELKEHLGPMPVPGVVFLAPCRRRAPRIRRVWPPRRGE